MWGKRQQQCDKLHEAESEILPENCRGLSKDGLVIPAAKGPLEFEEENVSKHLGGDHTDVWICTSILGVLTGFALVRAFSFPSSSDDRCRPGAPDKARLRPAAGPASAQRQSGGNGCCRRGAGWPEASVSLSAARTRRRSYS